LKTFNFSDEQSAVDIIFFPGKKYTIDMRNFVPNAKEAHYFQVS